MSVEKSGPPRKLAEFIMEASEISNLSTDYSIKWSDNDFLAVDIHDKYIKWKFNVSDFLYSLGLIDDGNFFKLGNVPLIKGGIEYGDKDSIESRKLIEDISVELNEKLKHLRESHILEKINEGNRVKKTKKEEVNEEGYKTTLKIKLKKETTKRGDKLFIQLYDRTKWVEIGLLSSGKVKMFLHLYNFDADIEKGYKPPIHTIIGLYKKAIEKDIPIKDRPTNDLGEITKVENQVKEFQRILTGNIKFIWKPNSKYKNTVQMIIDDKEVVSQIK